MEIKSKSALRKFLEKEILLCKGLVIIQAGHFALVYSKNENKLVPGIYQDVSNKEQKEAIKSHPYMGRFPLETWKLGVSLLDFCKRKNKNYGAVIIVNDWQWVPKMEDAEINPFRDGFYKNATLPVSYQKLLKRHNLDEGIIIPMGSGEDDKKPHIFFSEKKLRNIFSRKFNKVCELGENKCAQEYVPLLDQVIKQNAKLFISFVPKTCKIPIISGSEEIKNKFKTDIKIINIFANGISKNFFKDLEISII